MILWPPQAGFEPTESLGVWVRRAPFVFYDARGLIINLWGSLRMGDCFGLPITLLQLMILIE